jgi:methyltransferase
VSPSAPREDNGTYWGYTTRLASSLKDVFDSCPFDEGNGGYDFKVGTSERGDINIDNAYVDNSASPGGGVHFPAFKHAIVVFGGPLGIEECVDADESLRLPGSLAKKLFDVWINICPFQGSRTIRTEEALLIGLSKLSPLLFHGCESRKRGSTNRDETLRATGSILPVVDLPDEILSEESSDDDESDTSSPK